MAKVMKMPVRETPQEILMRVIDAMGKEGMSHKSVQLIAESGVNKNHMQVWLVPSEQVPHEPYIVVLMGKHMQMCSCKGFMLTGPRKGNDATCKHIQSVQWFREGV